MLAMLCVLCAPAAAQDAGWKTYSDAARGFSISYPADWKVNPSFTDRGYRFHQGDVDDVRDGVAFSPSVDLAPGTTLQSNQLVLAVERARPADSCKASAFLMDPPPDYFTQTVLDKPDAAQTLADAGDLYTIEHIVLIGSHTPCIAVHYYLVYARPQPGAALPAFNRQALFGLLNQIANTLKVKP